MTLATVLRIAQPTTMPILPSRTLVLIEGEDPRDARSWVEPEDVPSKEVTR